MTAVFYELEADRVEVDAVQAKQPWDPGRVRLTLWHRDDNGNFTDQVFDMSGESARDLAACLATSADEVSPPPVAVDDPPTVYREGNRIRHRDGHGYGDSVPDEHIRARAALDEDRASLLAAELERAQADAAFAWAVLELREVERRG